MKLIKIFPSFFLAALILSAGFVIPSCKKSSNKGGGTGVTIEIETSPPAGSVQAAAPGPDFPLVVTIKSAMPPSGVKIDIRARPEGSITPFFTQSVNSTNPVNNFTITGTPQAITSLVEVTVTDLANASNRVSVSYRYSRK